jgi:hypothetical protein
VRDPEHGPAVAILRPEAFKPAGLLQQATWLLTVKPERVTWQRTGETFEFAAGQW